MTLNPKLIAIGMTSMLLIIWFTPICAQQPQPKAKTATKASKTQPSAKSSRPASPKAASTPALPRTAAPVPANPPVPAAAANAAPEAKAEPIQPLLEANPAVRTALELPRKVPRDYVQAVLWLIDLGRPELAKPILDELTKLQITDAQRAALVDEFGSQGMLHMARTKELAPAGASFADECMAAAKASAENPQRIAGLIQQLTDLSPEVRFAAEHDIAATGQAGATALLEAFAREADPQRRAVILPVVASMHPLVDRPLLAMLETNDAALRGDVAAVLKQTRVLQAAPLVAASPASAERALVSAIDNYKNGTPPFSADDQNQIELWQWDDAAKKLSSARYPMDEARIAWMSKLARALARLQPTNRQYQLQAMLFASEAAQLGAVKRPSPAVAQLVETADVGLLNDVLAEALKQNLPHAAVAAADALGRRGDPSVLSTADGHPSPLADALESPNRRVRFAALAAIMTLDPANPYPGSSRLPDALAWFAGGTGERQGVVAMPTITNASNLAGMLIANSISAEATNRGRDVVQFAREMGDLEFILVDFDIIAPDIREVLYELRSTPSTGDIPIAIMAADGRLDAAKRLAGEHHHIIAISRLHSDDLVKRTLDELTKLSGPYTVGPEERAAEANQAKAWLAKLELGHRPFYVIRRTALLNPASPRAESPASQPKQ
jgi:CheY-like chemotaxis protein